MVIHSKMKKYVVFTVWNEKDERVATKDEISKNVEIVYLENGKCEIEVKDGYLLLSE